MTTKEKPLQRGGLWSRMRASRTYRLLRPAIRAVRGQPPRAVDAGAGSEPGELPIQEQIPEQPLLDVGAFTTPEARDLATRVNTVSWYHVIDLPYGVTTPGRADHRDDLAHYGLPGDMSGMRVLEVATFDGFWAFEFERRGAEVVATDLAQFSQLDLPKRILEQFPVERDRPTGDGFRLAHGALGSRVDRREISIYDLSPDNVGTFDLVFISDLLIHLRDAQGALERIYPLLRPGGSLVVAEAFDPRLEARDGAALIELRRFERYIWWIPSVAALRAMLNVAGFNQVEEVSRLMLKMDGVYGMNKVVLRAYPWVARATAEQTAAATR